ncbi:MAG: zinc ribbon domain-containing protein [Methanomassiliicoccus sp.]|nr:zinc ribbon domain-containing protein [Methanomassiliicoccus sp.]
MFCERCGSDIRSEAAFCKSCGHSLDESGPRPEPAAGHENAAAARKVSPNIVEDRNGSLSWAYELSFWKNPTILITVFKVMLISLSFVVLLTFLLALADGPADAAMFALTMFGIGAAIMTVLMVTAYVIVGLSYGGRYRVLFKMSDKGVHHIQLKKQYDRAAAFGLLTALAGLAGGNLTAAGAGLMSASRQSMYTEFADVRSIKVNRRRNVIYLSEGLAHNQVYAEDEDLPRIQAYILDHCPQGVRVR